MDGVREREDASAARRKGRFAKHVRATLVLAALWACGQIAVAEQAPKAKKADAEAQVAEIDVLCDVLAGYAKPENRTHLFGSGLEVGAADPKAWRKYASDDEVRAKIEKPDVPLGKYVVADVWKRPDGALHVETTSSSDSGDWMEFVRYCYRPDGTLARSSFNVNTFLIDDGIAGIRIRHFAPDGKQLRVRSETLDIETRKKRAKNEFDWSDHPYKTVSALPFASLLR